MHIHPFLTKVWYRENTWVCFGKHFLVMSQPLGIRCGILPEERYLATDRSMLSVCPLRVALYSEYTVPTYLPLSQLLSFILVVISFAFLFFFLIGLDVSYFGFWGDCYTFLSWSLYPGAALSNPYPLLLSCPADHGPDWQQLFGFEVDFVRFGLDWLCTSVSPYQGCI